MWVSARLNVVIFGFTPVRVDLSRFSCNLTSHDRVISAHITVIRSGGHRSARCSGRRRCSVRAGDPAGQAARRRRRVGSADIAESDRPAEAARFTAAAAAVADRLRDRAAHATGAASEVLAATATLAQDRAWLGAAEKRIKDGAPAVRAVVGCGRPVRRHVHQARRADGRTGHRPARHPRPRASPNSAACPSPASRCPTSRRSCAPRTSRPPTPPVWIPTLVVALATTLGGPTSHTAIIARQLGIPCVVAVDRSRRRRRRHHGARRRHPRHGHRRRRTRRRPRDAVAEAQRDAELAAHWSGPGATADGHAVAILANVQDGAAARAARETPAEGVGLFRTELCFLNRDTEPTVDEQADIYAEVLDAFAGHKVVIRTLDAGSDKPLKFAGHPDEANPALGVRGIRIAESNPGLLTRQLDARRRRGGAHRQPAVGDGADDRHRRTRPNALPRRPVRTG